MHQTLYDAEVEYRHHRIREQYIESRRIMSIEGMRQLIGNSVIALGSSIHGMAQESCKDAAETRDMMRTARRKHAGVAP